MKSLDVFEMEALEQRLEFRVAGGFWAALWDGICWFAESVWDVVQAAWATAGLSISRAPTGTWTIGSSFSGLLKTLGGNWSETWMQYFPGSTPAD